MTWLALWFYAVGFVLSLGLDMPSKMTARDVALALIWPIVGLWMIARELWSRARRP